jgi:hypothetical protein
MKKLTLCLLGAGCLGLGTVLGNEAPRGDLLELHSCAVYAGGCVVSSEATMGGRYMLRAWNFTGGEYSGVELAGLKLAALQVASSNLAARKTGPGHVVVYLPESASPHQRQALLAWFTARQLGGSKPAVATRVVPLRFTQVKGSCDFSAGRLISVRTVPVGHSDTWSCGESLWYTPRSRTSAFSVALDRSSTVREPILKLKWDDAGKKNAFLAWFGAGGVSTER